MSVIKNDAVATGETVGGTVVLMKAIVQERYGPPEALHLSDNEIPEIESGQVLVKVHAAAVNPYDWHMLRGDPRIARSWA